MLVRWFNHPRLLLLLYLSLNLSSFEEAQPSRGSGNRKMTPRINTMLISSRPIILKRAKTQTKQAGKEWRRATNCSLFRSVRL